jgi:hypothetical protein
MDDRNGASITLDREEQCCLISQGKIIYEKVKRLEYPFDIHMIALISQSRQIVPNIPSDLLIG